MFSCQFKNSYCQSSVCSDLSDLYNHSQQHVSLGHTICPQYCQVNVQSSPLAGFDMAKLWHNFGSDLSLYLIQYHLSVLEQQN